MSFKQPSPMEELMKALEADRELPLPMDATYYDRLHDRIMSAIDETPGSTRGRPPELKHKTWFEKPRSLFWRPWRALLDFRH